MAGLSNILGKGMMGNKSVYKTAQYERLTQDPDDNEEEDDVLYRKENGKQNGITHLEDTNESIELSNLQNGHGSPIIKKARVLGDPEVKVLKRRIVSRFSRTRLLCFLAVLLVAVALSITLALILPYVQEKKIEIPSTSGSQPVVDSGMPAWTATLDDIGSESCMRLLDMDGDGLEDIIVGVAYSYGFLPIDNEDDINDICAKQGKTPPCIGLILALRGIDGSELWRLNTRAPIFELNCGKIDVDQDGKMDCLGAGRMATIMAFDPRLGKVLWQGDNSALNNGWNNYNPVVLPDLDGDGVPDVLLPHGGDPTVPNYILERSAGRLLMLSGATGTQIGQSLEVPQSETYMSPIIHEMSDGAQYIVFGSGGEKVRGALYMISVEDFYRYIMRWTKDSIVPNTKGSYKDWDHLRHNSYGIYEIHETVEKGIMVPPVCVEMNGDDTLDLLVTTFEGDIILFNGKTFAAIWTRSFVGYETYSTPTPGYYNNDSVLDFMIHWSYGSWPTYNHSLAVILDGKTGHTLWSLQSSHYEMSSDLVLHTRDLYRDAFLFRVQGREAMQANEGHSSLHGVNPQRGKRSASQHSGYRTPYGYPSSQQYDTYDGYEYPRQRYYPQYETYEDSRYTLLDDDIPVGPPRTLKCPDDASNYLTEVFLMDRSLAMTPALMYSAPAQYYYYNVSSSLVQDNSVNPVEPDPEPIPQQGGPQKIVPAAAQPQQPVQQPMMHNGPPSRPVMNPAQHRAHMSSGSERLEDSPGFNYNYNPKHKLNTQQGKKQPPGRPQQKPAIPNQQQAYAQPIGAQTGYQQPIRTQYSSSAANRVPVSKSRWDAQNSSPYTSSRRKTMPPVYDSLGRQTPIYNPRGKRSRRSSDDTDVEKRQTDKMVKLCAVKRPSERTTAAIGDLDGDGHLDMVVLVDYLAEADDAWAGEYIPRHTTVISKVNLEIDLNQPTLTPVDAKTLQHNSQSKLSEGKITAVKINDNTLEQSLSSVGFKPLDQQPWRQYMGTYGDSVYDGHQSKTSESDKADDENV